MTTPKDRINQLIAELSDVDQELAINAETQERLTKRRREIVADRLPELLGELGVVDLTLDDGTKIEIKEIVTASLPSVGGIKKAKGEKKDALLVRLRDGLEWLRKHGHGDVIKHEIVVSLPAGDDSVAEQIEDTLKNIGVSYSDTETVHAQTLKALVKELVETGAQFPEETFGFHLLNEAKVKRPDG